MFSANLVQHTRILILAGFISDETYRKCFFYKSRFFITGTYGNDERMKCMERHVYQKETAEVMDELQTSLQGLDSDEAAERLSQGWRQCAGGEQTASPVHDLSFAV